MNTTPAFKTQQHSSSHSETCVPSEATRKWYLRVSETWHSMSQVLGLKRIQELIQGTCSLSEQPLWLLGLWYGLLDKDSNAETLPQEMLQLVLEDFSSKFWFTYRREFAPLGQSQLSSDVGWGCTIRSGQMLMAEAIARCWWGRASRASQQHSTPECAAAAGAAGQPLPGRAGDQLALLQLFHDQPSPASPFSIHNICRAGAQHGVVPGQWLGPWVLCKALGAAAAEQQQQQQWPLGLQVHVVCDPGGGAPTLQLDRMKELLAGHSSSAPQVAANPTAAGSVPDRQQQQGLLLLVPLTLGVGKVNERYLPQLAAVLTFPQSVGIVGGRPSASLYFLGVQGSSVLYLDPHEAQQVADLPNDVSTFHCTTPRLMPLTSIDPSLAIGFYCSSTGDLEDLAQRLEQLASASAGAPLMTVDHDVGRQQLQGASSSAEAFSPEARNVEAAQHQGTAEDWEFV